MADELGRPNRPERPRPPQDSRIDTRGALARYLRAAAQETARGEPKPPGAMYKLAGFVVVVLIGLIGFLVLPRDEPYGSLRWVFGLLAVFGGVETYRAAQRLSYIAAKTVEAQSDLFAKRRAAVVSALSRAAASIETPEEEAVKRVIVAADWIESQPGWNEPLLDETRIRVDLDAEVKFFVERLARANSLRATLGMDAHSRQVLDSVGRALERRADAFEAYLSEAAWLCSLATELRTTEIRSRKLRDLERLVLESGVDDVQASEWEASRRALETQRAAIVEQVESVRVLKGLLGDLDTIDGSGQSD